MLEDEFSDILKKAERGAGLNAAALARLTGFHPSQIANWEQGQGAPNEDEARALAASLKLDPAKFADAAAARWHPPAIEVSDVRHHPQHPHPSNGYVFFLEGGKRAALVDPAGMPQNLLTILRGGNYGLQYILITHKHPDHCDATAEVAAAFPDSQIVMHEADVHAIGSLAGRALAIKDGEDLPFGNDTRIRMLHTPGHTDGSSSFIFKSTVFTGDTLFAGSVGGAYGDKSTYEDILNSVRTKLFNLPDDAVIMPGHGPPSTIQEEKEHNPFFTV